MIKSNFIHFFVQLPHHDPHDHHDHHDTLHDGHLPHNLPHDHQHPQFPIILAAAIPVPVGDESAYLRQRPPFLGSRDSSSEYLRTNSSPTNSYLQPRNKVL